MVMPAMGGPALARKLKPVRPGLKVMFMSGYADATPGDRDVLDEPTLFLQKPFALSVLVDKVREALDRAAPNASALTLRLTALGEDGRPESPSLVVAEPSAA